MQVSKSEITPVTTDLHGAKVMTGLGKTTLFDLVKEKKIRSTLVGRRRLFFVDSLREMLESGAA